MKITVVGMGYVGLSNAVLLSQKNEVVVLDVLKDKVKMLNNKISPIVDREITLFLNSSNLCIKATLNEEEAYKYADYVIVATPTNYEEEAHCFDTSSIETVIESALKYNDNCVFIIKSTIPIGYTERLKKRFSYEKIIFLPEFLREGKALYDNLNPSRVVVGGNQSFAEKYVMVLKDCIKKKNVPILFMGSDEAEAVKLFSNAYLAMRVAYFNEIDTYAQEKNLDIKNIIRVK